MCPRNGWGWSLNGGQCSLHHRKNPFPDTPMLQTQISGGKENLPFLTQRTFDMFVSRFWDGNSEGGKKGKAQWCERQGYRCVQKYVKEEEGIFNPVDEKRSCCQKRAWKEPTGQLTVHAWQTETRSAQTGAKCRSRLVTIFSLYLMFNEHSAGRTPWWTLCLYCCF